MLLGSAEALVLGTKTGCTGLVCFTPSADELSSVEPNRHDDPGGADS